MDDDIEGFTELDAFSLQVDAKLRSLEADLRDLARRMARKKEQRERWLTVRHHLQATQRAEAVAQAKQETQDDEAEEPTQLRSSPPGRGSRWRSV